jgi:YidC/Oxa1 family membrane protein insertase
MDNHRLILFVVLAFLLLLLWQSWVDYNRPEIEQAATTTAQESIASGQNQSDSLAVPETPSAVPQQPAAPPSATATEADAKGKQVTVVTDLLKVEMNTHGAGIRKVWLLTYPVEVDKPDEPFQLMNDVGIDIFMAQGGLIGHERQYPTHKTLFTTSVQNVELADGKEDVSVEFVWNAPDGITYKKIYTFYRASYVVDIEYRVINSSGTEWRGYQYNQFRRTQVVDSGSFNPMSMVPTYTGGAIYDRDEKYRKISFSDMQETNLKERVDNGWVAMLQHYFVGSWLLEDGKQYEIYSRVLPGTQYSLGYTSVEPTVVAAGKSGSLSTSMFVGPKEVKQLEKTADGMELTVDYGWLTPVSAPLFWLLDKIHIVVGNWGWAIIILTLLIKLVFYPLSAASHKSMANMRKVAPRIQTLKERFGDDKQKLNQAMMELYKKEKINPLGGCLPILIQIPVFIALYWTLLESVELRQAPWILWIRDLSTPDPYFVLPIIMGVSMLVQQMLSAVAMDPMQKKIMMAMPVVFTFFFLFFPSGLVLYWTVNNLLTIAQQYYINKKMGV